MLNFFLVGDGKVAERISRRNLEMLAGRIEDALVLLFLYVLNIARNLNCTCTIFAGFCGQLRLTILLFLMHLIALLMTVLGVLLRP